MRRERWWEKFQADRYPSGELATELGYRKYRLNVEILGDHPHWFGIWLKTPAWVYRLRWVRR